MASLSEIEGIGPVYASKLEAIGVNSVEELLQKGGHTAERETLAAQSGLTYEQILEWVNRADLFRINGVGSEYSDLLEAAGVDTVPELAQRNAANLTAKLAEVNAEKNLVRALPTEEEVAGWIAQAKDLPRMVWYESRSGGANAGLTDLLEIEGIGPEYKARLVAAGINSVEELLAKGAHTKDREDIAEASGLTYHQILEWVNRADLFRIKGVGSEYSDLLEVAGVDTVMELAQRNPANLTAKLAETDSKTDIVRRLPTETEVTDWITQAKALPRAVWYESRTRKLATDDVVVTPLASATALVGAATGAAVVTDTLNVVSSGDDAAIVRDVAVTAMDAETKETTEAERIAVVPLAAAAAAPILAAVAGDAPKAEVEEIPPVEPIPVVEPARIDPIPVVATEKAVESIPIAPVVAAAAVPLAAAALKGASDFDAAPVVTEKKPDEPPPVARREPVPVAAPIPAPPTARMTLWPWLFLIGVALAGLLFSNMYCGAGKPTPTPEAPVAAIATPAAAPTAEAVAAAVIPDVAVGDVLTLFDGGMKTWFEPAADAFNKTRTDGKVVVVSLGSREGRDHILYNRDTKVQPAVWAPGDKYWIGKIQRDAADPSVSPKSGASVNDGKDLVNTYVVLLIPEVKAKAFATAAAKPEFAGKTWKLLHQIATKGWASIGGDPAWGKLKLAQADPTKANSGMAALTLMYQEWAKDNPGKSINDKGFLKWMGAIEGTVTEYAPSTAEMIQAFVSDPGMADMAIVYESDAIRAMDSGAKNLRVVYPSPTAAITIPASVVKATWVSEGRAKLAGDFVDYLLTETVQADATKAGYRPANPAVAAKTTEMLTKHQAAGVTANPVAAPTPDTKTREGLIYNWDQWHKK